MSDHIGSSLTDSAGSHRGQSLVEFALVLPMLLVLLLGIADFGRVFQAGIVTEAAARSGAESAALERLRNRPSTPGDTAYYQRLHTIAAQAACAEVRVLPNTTYVPDNPLTPSVDEESCPSMPPIAVCVQDGQDPLCGQLAPGFAGPAPPQCSELTRSWDGSSGGRTGSHSVEVRLCYRFTTLFNLNFSLPLGWGLSLGDVWLQKSRTFVVDCSPGEPSGC
jgi:hypothetical protein